MEDVRGQLAKLIGSLKRTGYSGYKVFKVSLQPGQSWISDNLLANSIRFRSYTHQNFEVSLNDGDPLDMSIVTIPEDPKDYPFWKLSIKNISATVALDIIFVVSIQVVCVLKLDESSEDELELTAPPGNNTKEIYYPEG